MKRSILLCLFPALLLANDEYKVIDKLIAAQRHVEEATVKGDRAATVMANHKSEVAGAKAVAYCGSVGKILILKRNGLMGCVAKEAAKRAAHEQAVCGDATGK